MTFRRAAYGRVAEAVADTGGRLVYRCRIITAGLNLSGDTVYPAEVLERDGAAAFPIGTKSEWNHPSFEEEWNRPEGNARNLAAKQVSEAGWDAATNSLYADFEFNEQDRAYVEQFHDVLAMSIYAFCESTIGTIGSFTGDVITSLVPHPLNRVDVVTVAGANGAILNRVSEGLKFFGASGTPAPAVAPADSPAPTITTEGMSMTPEEVSKAVEAGIIAATALIKESLTVAPTSAVDGDDTVVGFELIAESGLPKAARTVAYEAVRAGSKAEDVVADQKRYVESIREGFVPTGTAGTRTEAISGAPLGTVAPAAAEVDEAAAWKARRESRKVSK